MKTNEQQPQGQQSRSLVRGRAYPLDFVLTTNDLFRMTPFSLMRRMSEEMDRVLGEYGMSRGDGGKSVWSPLIEVSEHDGNYVLRAELPGLNPSDVKLEMTDEAVIIEGERKIQHQETKGGVQITERKYGRFYRAIPLPEGADVEKAQAKYENGVLEVTVPLTEQRAKGREIPIQTASQPSTGTAGKAA
jgi:HSP20 family protein